MVTAYKRKTYVPADDIQNIQKRNEHPIKSQISVNYNGTNVKPSVSPTYINVVNPQVTFTYEYLW